MLFIVLGVIMVLALLSTVIMRVVSNQSRLTHHQVSRIQAMYAAKAGVLYALDKLRRNDDPTCVAAGGWTMKSSGPGACVVIEPAFSPNAPYYSPVSSVVITVGAPDSGPVTGTRRVSAQTIYTYTP